jgi:4-hydroxy-tetrahydrodipicolinate synthase
MAHELHGIFAAAPTPINTALAVDVAGVAPLLEHLRRVGCHGALVLGTTGEGPCLSVAERKAVMDAASEWRKSHAEFRLLAGTGAAALPDAVELTRHAVDSGFDGQLVLPGFYFKGVSDRGIVDWFLRLADGAPGANILLYHIPAVSGVGIPVPVAAELVQRLPGVVTGIKDSSGDLDNTLALCAIDSLAVFTGTDTHLAACLAAGGAGAITALANVLGEDLRAVYDGAPTADTAFLLAARAAFEAYASVPAVKGLLARSFGLPRWRVRPPLMDLREDEVRALAEAVFR